VNIWWRWFFLANAVAGAYNEHAKSAGFWYGFHCVLAGVWIASVCEYYSEPRP
jgi:hypothetical protein